VHTVPSCGRSLSAEGPALLHKGIKGFRGIKDKDDVGLEYTHPQAHLHLAHFHKDFPFAVLVDGPAPAVTTAQQAQIVAGIHKHGVSIGMLDGFPGFGLLFVELEQSLIRFGSQLRPFTGQVTGTGRRQSGGCRQADQKRHDDTKENPAEFFHDVLFSSGPGPEA
jgi:hypothetical protein